MSEPRYWDDVATGDVTQLDESFSTQRLVVWAAASGDFYQIHYDEDFAKKNNLPGVIVHGALKGMILGRLLREWVGPRGRIVSWDASYRGMDPVREDLKFWAKITRKYERDGESLLDLELGVRGPDGRETTPGSAIVALPRRA